MLTIKLCKACKDGNVNENEAAVDPLEASNAWTPLMLAALKSADSPRHVAVMMALLDNGADVEVADAKGNTVLHILASLGQTELIRRLLKQFSALDILGPGFGYMTPLHYATEAGHLETVEFLLQQGADPRGVDATGWTPMHWACRRGSKQIVERLLMAGGSLEDRDFRSLTALDVACVFGHTALAKLLEASRPLSHSALFALPSEDPEAEQKNADGDDDQPLSLGVPTDPAKETVFPTSSPLRVEKLRDKSKLLAVQAYRRLLCWTLGPCVVCLSLYDYASRISLAVFLAAAAQGFEQQLGATPYAAVALLILSVVVPSAGFGICCSRHLRSTISWAASQAARIVHLAANSDSGGASSKPARGLLRRCSLRCLFAADLFVRLQNRLVPRGSTKGVHLAAAMCALVPAAAACCVLLILQVLLVAAAALGAATALWACGSIGVVMLKLFLVHPSILLRYLDCLTHGTAVKLPAREAEKIRPAEALSPSVAGAASRKAELKRLDETGPEGHASEDDAASPSPLALLETSSGSQVGEGRLRVIGEEGVDGVSSSTGCHNEPRRSLCSEAPEAASEEAHAAAASGAGRRRTPWELPLPRKRFYAHYATATLEGRIPQQLHPCPSLKGAIQLHRQHAEGCRDVHCRLTHGTLPFASASRKSVFALDMHSLMQAEEQAASEGKAREGLPEAGWRFTGSSDAVQAAAALRRAGTLQSSEPITGEKSKERSLSTRLQGSSLSESRLAALSASGTRPNGSALEEAPALLAFAYGVSSEGVDVAPSSTHEEESAGAASETAGSRRKTDAAITLSESVVSLLVRASPYRWIRQHAGQQSADSPQSSPTSPCFIFFDGMRTPRLGLSNPQQAQEKSARSCRLYSQLKTPRDAAGSAKTSSACRGLKLLFADPQLQRGGGGGDGGSSEALARRRTQYSSLAFRVLKSRKQRALPSQLDPPAYNAMILKRKQCIYSWYERLVGLRYAEVEGARSKTAEKKAYELTSESAQPTCEGHPEEAGSALSYSAISSHCGYRQVSDTSIKWSSFDSLFQQDEGKKATHRKNPEELWKPEDVTLYPRADPRALACMPAEDLFDLHSTPSPSTLQHYAIPIQPHHHKQQEGHGPSTDCQQSSQLVSAAEHCNANCTFRDVATDQQLQTALHYRFKDMVEMPHLREMFFAAWCREFEKLLTYQDTCFGSNPMWVENALEEDSVSAFSVGFLDSSPVSEGDTASSLLRPSIREKAEMADSKQGEDRPKEVFWVFPEHVHVERAERSRKAADPSAIDGDGGSGDGAEGLSDCCSGYVPPEPPMMCAVAVSRCKLEAWKHDTSVKTEGYLVKGSAFGSTLSSHATSSPSSLWGDFEKLTLTDEDNDVSPAEGKSVLVVEACRFLFALALTLDLLGLFPLLSAIVLLYLLPHRLSPHSASRAADPSAFPAVCAETAASPAGFPGGYLVASRPLSFTATLCALDMLPFWSLMLIVAIAVVHAGLLFGQAGRIFFLPQRKLLTSRPSA
ncbi:hypothetical protein cyc_04245 [Cyclospora cayetanensis]|uniref:Uncharacterized protein n=1 Tax=Cyclospora cayetanensis TaxID=88456 RepID=A0A1D3D8A7_9EIME|nr:hypothetical protein cyc_04245 [Cyclospora cayetanensis]